MRDPVQGRLALLGDSKIRGPLVPIGAQPGVTVLDKPGWWRAEILRPQTQAGLGRPATLHEFASRREFAEVGRDEGQGYFA